MNKGIGKKKIYRVRKERGQPHKKELLEDKDKAMEETLEAKLKGICHQLDDDADVKNILVTTKIEPGLASEVEHVMSTTVEAGGSMPTDDSTVSVAKLRKRTATTLRTRLLKRLMSDKVTQLIDAKISAAETSKALQEEYYQIRKKLMLEEHELKLRQMKEKHAKEMETLEIDLGPEHQDQIQTHLNEAT
ncbi:uncharacterized protein LOC106671968 [Cimex lectularius]|uniref:Uncharacterized protein n=1 Tax=Cimex lectularius TaxID=79782 RepID=A0A8I6S8F2_CIMLE|nr:uncharacterized protein LOC106671968 [Cimex lectularius]